MAVVTCTNQTFENEVLRAKKPVLLDFFAPWCGPCRMLSPIVDQIAQEEEGRVKVCKVNIDEQPELAARFGVMSIPTLIVLREGQVTATSVGLKPKAEVLRLLES